MTHNYGVLTELSKGANALLGDKTGRTVSRRTADGFQRALAPNASDQLSEDVVHAGMVGVPLLLRAKHPVAKAIGVGIGLWLFGCYHAGQ